MTWWVWVTLDLCLFTWNYWSPIAFGCFVGEWVQGWFALDLGFGCLPMGCCLCCLLGVCWGGELVVVTVVMMLLGLELCCFGVFWFAWFRGGWCSFWLLIGYWDFVGVA